MSVREIVNLWFAERIAHGAIARDTEAYNQAAAAVPDLISLLEAAAVSVAADPVQDAGIGDTTKPAKKTGASAGDPPAGGDTPTA